MPKYEFPPSTSIVDKSHLHQLDPSTTSNDEERRMDLSNQLVDNEFRSISSTCKPPSNRTVSRSAPLPNTWLRNSERQFGESNKECKSNSVTPNFEKFGVCGRTMWTTIRTQQPQTQFRAEMRSSPSWRLTPEQSFEPSLII
jgi:hypothetical protein